MKLKDIIDTLKGFVPAEFAGAARLSPNDNGPQVMEIEGQLSLWFSPEITSYEERLRLAIHHSGPQCIENFGLLSGLGEKLFNETLENLLAYKDLVKIVSKGDSRDDPTVFYALPERYSNFTYEIASPAVEL